MTRLLSQRLRNHRLFLFDGEGAGGTGTGTAVADPAKPAADPVVDPAAGDTGKPAEPAKVSMTQAELDALINKAHGKGAAAAEKNVKEYLAAEALTGEQKITAERDAAIARADAAANEALQVRVETQAERAALTAKVDPSRVDRFLRLVDLKAEELIADGKADATAIAAAVAKTLTDFPEFASGAPAPAGASGTEFTNNGTKVWTRADIAKLSPAEFDKHKDEILAQTAAGSVK